MVSPDGYTLISGSRDGTVRLWRLFGQLIGQVANYPERKRWTIGFMVDNTTCISLSRDRTLHTWQLQADGLHKIQYRELTTCPGVSSEPIVAISPDAQRLAIAPERGGIFVAGLQGDDHDDRLLGTPGDVATALAFSPTGDRLISGGGHRIVMWDIHQGNPIEVDRFAFYGHRGFISAIAASPTQPLIATGGIDTQILIWNWEGDLLSPRTSEKHEGWIKTLAFSPDGRLLVSGSQDKTLRLWDVNGQPIGQPFVGHEGSVNAVAFSSDGTMIVSASADKTIRLWDLQGNELVHPLPRHTSGIHHISLSQDGRIILSSGRDGSLSWWQGNWQSWLCECCDRIRYHPDFQAPKTDEARAACDVCRKHVWK